ncbi:hypothetical protein [Halapricum hydrolyticum]|uniref:DUF4013 domain-containing protein n=1 Tax=Halapricum hydrolyticum TaxID=2979991 RepID=A0AAE3I8F8_9EURY|nr:hypothetical protein [Halapricum hydrolyticum]MCU4716790.1 hypothetical protein [Halapricum hydrolyticum]MCU4725605.1 hypothetical protein [Halapricum hydrolyticum]
MSLRDDSPPDPMLVLRTFGRIAVSDAVTIVVLSVLYSVASLSIVTIGPALLALMDTFYASVTHTGTGGGAPDSVTGRASHFVSSIWTYFRAGLAYTVVILGSGVAMYVYLRLALYGDSIVSLLGGVLGLYAVVVVLVLLFRAADIVVREDESDRPGFVGGLRLAWHSMGANVPYSAIHAVTAIVLTLVPILVLTPLAVVFVLPGLLALLELLAYEELHGAGAKTIRFAYLDLQE